MGPFLRSLHIHEEINWPEKKCIENRWQSSWNTSSAGIQCFNSINLQVLWNPFAFLSPNAANLWLNVLTSTEFNIVDVIEQSAMSILNSVCVMYAVLLSCVHFWTRFSVNDNPIIWLCAMFTPDRFYSILCTFPHSNVWIIQSTEFRWSKTKQDTGLFDIVVLLFSINFHLFWRRKRKLK